MRVVLDVKFILGCLVLLGIAVALGIYYSIQESFEDQATVVAPDSDIHVQTCPSGSTSFIKNTKMYCCEGTIVDGDCSGKTVCGLSNDPSVKTCTSLLRAQLTKKAGTYCPPSMSNFFEDDTKTPIVRGCCSGSRTPDGKGVLSTPGAAGQRTCKVYNVEADELSHVDSCTNIKRSEQYTCPNGQHPSIVSIAAGRPAVLQCTLLPTSGIPEVCFENRSFSDYYRSLNQNWRQSLTPQEKLKFCSVAEQYYVKKAINNDDLPNLNIDYPQHTVKSVGKGGK
jgi:hypothetical protein